MRPHPSATPQVRPPQRMQKIRWARKSRCSTHRPRQSPSAEWPFRSATTVCCARDSTSFSANHRKATRRPRVTAERLPKSSTRSHRCAIKSPISTRPSSSSPLLHHTPAMRIFAARSRSRSTWRCSPSRMSTDSKNSTRPSKRKSRRSSRAAIGWRAMTKATNSKNQSLSVPARTAKRPPEKLPPPMMAMATTRSSTPTHCVASQRSKY